MLLWIHPLIQTLCLLLAVWVLHMGIRRFRAQHMGVKVMFPWKQHVFWGKIVHVTWVLGMLLGLFMAWYAWGDINLTGPHFLVGVTMIPFLAVGLITGLMLQKPKGKRTALALVHGISNLVLFALAIYQAISSIEVIVLFLLG